MKADKPTQDDIARLKAWIEKNDYTVYTVLRHVSKSGMYREISVVIPVEYQNKRKGFVHPSYTIAGILGWKYTENHGHNAIGVSGCGMDMGFHIVESLSYKLYDDGYKIQQEWI